MLNPTPAHAQESSANIVEFPTPSRWAGSPKEHTRKICTLAFKQMNRDHELSAHARSVGIDILAHVNWEDGFADVSMLETAKRLGFKEDTVSKCRDALVARGYFRYQPGKAGRGYSGRYWPILQPAENPHAAGYFEEEKTPVPHPENPQMAEIKPPWRGVEQYSNNIENKSAALPRSSADADRADVTETEPRPEISARERAFGALGNVFHKGSDIPNRAETRKLFDQVMDHGFDPEGLIDEAEEHTSTWLDPKTEPSLRDWLENKYQHRQR